MSRPETRARPGGKGWWIKSALPAFGMYPQVECLRRVYLERVRGRRVVYADVSGGTRSVCRMSRGSCACLRSDRNRNPCAARRFEKGGRSGSTGGRASFFFGGRCEAMGKRALREVGRMPDPLCAKKKRRRVPSAMETHLWTRKTTVVVVVAGGRVEGSNVRREGWKGLGQRTAAADEWSRVPQKEGMGTIKITTTTTTSQAVAIRDGTGTQLQSCSLSIYLFCFHFFVDIEAEPEPGGPTVPLHGHTPDGFPRRRLRHPRSASLPVEIRCQ